MSTHEKMEFNYKPKWTSIVFIMIIGFGLSAFAFNEAVNCSGVIELKNSTLSGTTGHLYIWVLAVALFLIGSLGVAGIVSRFTIEPKITLDSNYVSVPGPIWSPKHRVHDLSKVVSSKTITIYGNQLFEIKTTDSRLSVASSNFDSVDHFNQFVAATTVARR
ncbi:hypothetical protein [Arsukibacterium indicum]|uniref:PH domain-containing protein n=1 Tax=Arsukibacterium indicum TaxID=2848612 RepID=A0ABS6MHL8_9GAMM|nr:hypothetical protein [Arsukibacterium indicum]MBV2128302.1 hypothetical protein [Arsukibacterium indicum]